jgi:hypothetical protein
MNTENSCAKEGLSEVAVELLRAAPTSPIAIVGIAAAVAVASAEAHIPAVTTFLDEWRPHIGLGIVLAVVYYWLVSMGRAALGVHRIVGHYEGVAAAYTVAKALPSQGRSEQNKWASSVHEAGHVLTVALLPNDLVPDNLSVHIRQTVEDMNDGFAGQLCFSFESGEHPSDPVFLEWQLICYRAGAIAERILLDKDTTGHGKDYADWQRLARKRLVLYSDQAYFAEPASEAEARLNHQAFVSLAEENDATAMRLLEGNKGLLRALAENLCDKGQLTRSEILELVGQVHIEHP